MAIIKSQTEFEKNRYNWEKTMFTWTWIRENDDISKKEWKARGFEDYLDTGNAKDNINKVEWDMLFKAYIHHTTEIARAKSGGTADTVSKWLEFKTTY